LRQALREMDANRDEMRTRDLEVVRRKRLEADSLVSVPSLNEHIASVEGIAERYGDDEEFQNESRMLRARLHTVALTEAAPPVTEPRHLREKASSAKKSRGMPPLLLTGVAAVLLAAVGAWLWHRAALRKPPARALTASPPFVDVTVRSTPAGA